MEYGVLESGNVEGGPTWGKEYDHLGGRVGVLGKRVVVEEHGYSRG